MTSSRVRTGRDTVAVPFRYYSAVAAANVTISVSPNATFSPRLFAIADDFDEFRIVKLRFRLHQGVAATAATMTAAFLPGIVDTPPAGDGNRIEILNSILISAACTKPSEWSQVPRGVLAGMHPWYKSAVGTPEASEETQGILTYNSNAQTSLLEWEGVCEFRAAVASANTPLERALAARKREKKRIMAVLATDDSVPTSRVGKS